MLKGSIGIIMIGLIVARVFVPVDIPYEFDSTAKVYPVQQWILQKNQDGSLLSTLHNYKSGLLKDYSSFQFDRGDVINIQFNPNRITQNRVDSGALIATISSNMLSERLVKLENELSIEQASLMKALAGQKSEIVDKAGRELSLGKQELMWTKKQFERTKQMSNEGLIAYAEFEQAESFYQQAQTRVKVAEEQINVTVTGERPEEINFIKAKITSIEKEIAFFNNTSNSYNIYAPITGKLSYETTIEADQLIIEDTTEQILYIPIKLRDRDFLGDSTKIELSIIGQDSLIEAELLEVNDKVEILNRKIVVLAKAKVDGKIRGLSTGMPVKCKVYCGKVKPLEYMKRSMKMDLK